MARKSLAVLVVTVLLASLVAPAAAHSWQTEVVQGDFELGVSSTPKVPVAGMTTEFSARIADATPGDNANRTDSGSVTNKEVEVHINGPDDVHDHVKATIPEDDAHFHWNYVFPADGVYTMTVVVTLEGEEYAFEFTRDVMLLPAKATGEEMDHLSEDVHAVNENVEATNENVQDLQSQVETLSGQVEDLSTQVDDLSTQLEAEENVDASQAPGFGIVAVLVALAGAALIIGRRV